MSPLPRARAPAWFQPLSSACAVAASLCVRGGSRGAFPRPLRPAFSGPMAARARGLGGVAYLRVTPLSARTSFDVPPPLWARPPTLALRRMQCGTPRASARSQVPMRVCPAPARAQTRQRRHKALLSSVISRFDSFQLSSSDLSAARVAAPSAPAALQQRVATAVAAAAQASSPRTAASRGDAASDAGSSGSERVQQ